MIPALDNFEKYMHKEDEETLVQLAYFTCSNLKLFTLLMMVMEEWGESLFLYTYIPKII